MKVLVFNCGSSSLKYKLIEMPSGEEVAGGEAQSVGPPTEKPPRIVHHVGDTEEVRDVEMPNHAAAYNEIMQLLESDKNLIPDALGHRMVHGGTIFSKPAVIDEDAMSQLQETRGLAPLHNPPAINLVEACRERDPEVPEVAVFDTAFHSTIPGYASTYALPRELREEMGIRKCGFHGTSHQYVAQQAAKFLGKPMNKFNAVSCHLGSGGASLCAIVDGKSVDNTMGYSPLQGLVMSTRCGDLDPAVALDMLARTDGDNAAVETALNKRSGVLGMSGASADIRDVLAHRSGSLNESRTDLTAQVYLWRIRKYLGAYLAVVGNADAVIFTDTIGETMPQVRWGV